MPLRSPIWIEPTAESLPFVGKKILEDNGFREESRSHVKKREFPDIYACTSATALRVRLELGKERRMRSAEPTKLHRKSGMGTPPISGRANIAEGILNLDHAL